nr:MBL fold metallo-hydrolase [Desulfocapsaceae bacterium]
MKLEYDIIVQGNNLKLANGFLGISNVTLIKCSGGPILVDTGGYTTRLALLDGLKKHGLTPADIPVVFLTHLHFDHAHNIDFFPHAKIIMSKRELAYVANPHPSDLFIPWGLHDFLENCEL